MSLPLLLRKKGAPWSPIVELAPLHGWDASLLTGSDASQISSVPDLGSATARNLTPVSAGQEPLLKLAIQNGRNVGRFDGTNDGLQTAAFAVAIAQPFWVFHVGRQSDITTDDMFFDSTNRALLAATNVGPTYQHYAGGSILTGGTPDATNWYCFACFFSGAASFVLRNNVSIITGNPGTATLANITIGIGVDGASSPFLGDWGETWVAAGANVTLQKAQDFYTRYAKPKWGL